MSLRRLSSMFCLFSAVGLLVFNVGCGRKESVTNAENRGGDAMMEPTSTIEESRPLSIQADEGESPSASEPDPPPRNLSELQAGALRALSEGDDDSAFAIARQAMRLAPEDPQVVFLMAMVLGQRQRFPEAIQMLDELAERSPETRLPALGQTADWMVRFGQWADAEARYRQLLIEVPDSVMVHRNLARLLLRQGRRVEAADHLQQLCRAGDVTELELRSMLKILCPLSGDVERDELDPIGALALARGEISLQQWDAARQRLEQLDSDQPQVTALLGRIYANGGDFDALESWMASHAESENLNADAWYAKGAHAAWKGNHSLAVRCLVEAVQLDQTDHDAYSMLSRSLAEIGATRESEEASNRAERIKQSQRIGAQMSESTDRDLAAISSLIDLLNQLKRPLESLAWRGVQLVYAQEASSISDDEAQQVLKAIMTERTATLAAGTSTASREFVTCGVAVGQ